MREIPGLSLWIGNAGDARRYAALADRGIRAVVQLAWEEPPWAGPREMIVLRFPLVDGDGNDPVLLEAAITATAHLIRREVPTLVACSAGMSRSPCVAATALALVGREPPEVVLHRIQSGQPSDVAPALWSEAVNVLAKLPPG